MFDLNSLTEKHFNWQTALSMALSSDLVYQPAKAAEGVVTDTWHLNGCKYLEGGHIACFVAHTDSAIVVAFRGTQSVADWLSDLDVAGTPTPYGRLHRGFVDAYHAVAQDLANTIKSLKPQGKIIHLTGHSLGAALATIAACELHDSVSITGIYTFGQPRLGDQQTVDFFEANYPGAFQRFVFDDDVVTRIPPGYLHVGQLYHFDSNGILLTSAGEALGAGPSELPALSRDEFDGLKATAKTVNTTAKAATGFAESAEAESAEEVADRSIEGIFPSIRDHRMSRYLFAIRNQIPRPAELFSEAVADTTLEMFDLSTAGKKRDAGTRYPVQLRVCDIRWKPPSGAAIISQIGPFYSLQATKDEIAEMQTDPGVASLNLGREIDFPEAQECSVSVPFVNANAIHSGALHEKGGQAIIATIDSGIDILHEVFLDRDLSGGGATSRIDAVWNQRRTTRGQTPHQLEPQTFLKNLDFGTLYLAKDINAFVNSDLINKNSTTPYELRDPGRGGGKAGHGTHVASIAAGRAVGSFGGGMAPEARIVVVIPDLKTQPPNPPSLGYSGSHSAALEFLLAYKKSRGLPMAVNVSLGMNAGAHDGMTDLEKVFDTVSTKGKEEGFVIVKSAGNERGYRGHAQVQAAQGGMTQIEWGSDSTPRTDDYLEFWYSSGDVLDFRLVDPSGTSSPIVNPANPTGRFRSQGNDISLELTQYHPDNNDSVLKVKVIPVARSIQAGTWTLKIVGTSINPAGNPLNGLSGIVDGWVERSDARPVSFTNAANDDMTLSIPGTADTVIAVAASDTNTPLTLIPESSYGPTRKNGAKPDLNAPGSKISAACSNAVDPHGQPDHQAVVTMSGTSMAAPHVTGAMALVLSARHKKCQNDASKKQFNAMQLAGMVRRSAKNYNHLHNKGYGYGGLDASSFFTEAGMR
jgi:subtilisin family serine protease/pimeloyl-ACP methyl ester carboxylesterase